MSTDSALKLGGRLKTARESLGFTQQKMAEEVGCSKSAWVEYEYDLKIPGSKVLAGLSKLDFNTNWILVGQGLPKTVIDYDLLLEVTDAIDSFKKKYLKPWTKEKRRELVELFYEDFIEKENAGIQRGNVEEKIHRQIIKVSD